VTANTAAWAAARVFGTRWTAPLDGGKTLRDGTRVLGSHKTWRGLIAGAVACGVAAQLFRLGFALGAAFGTLALLGDAASSFVKRRMRLPPGAEVPGLDEVAEAILPLIALQRPLGLGVVEILIVTAVFAVLDIAATRLRRS
jgi:CDP-2,3-bis-(O-geranylgeranyl)-sn-glycerol synthase